MGVSSSAGAHFFCPRAAAAPIKKRSAGRPAGGFCIPFLVCIPSRPRDWRCRGDQRVKWGRCRRRCWVRAMCLRAFHAAMQQRRHRERPLARGHVQRAGGLHRVRRIELCCQRASFLMGGRCANPESSLCVRCRDTHQIFRRSQKGFLTGYRKSNWGHFDLEHADFASPFLFPVFRQQILDWILSTLHLEGFRS